MKPNFTIKSFCCLVFLIVITILNYSCQKEKQAISLADYAGTDTVLKVLKFLKIDINKSKQLAPHFPDPTPWIKDLDKKDYASTFKSWTTDHFSEFQSFANDEYIKKQGFAWESLGLKNPYINKKYFSSFSQAAAILSPKRLKKIAPHFPDESLANSKEEYDSLITLWQKNYAKEYENWLNAPEIVAIKPEGSQGKVDLGILADLPEFMHYPDFDQEYPVQAHSESDEEFNLKVQHWYFVFHPKEYVKKYGKLPKLPKNFDVEKYRLQYYEEGRYEYEAN